MRGKNSEIVRTGGNGRRSSCVAYGGLLYISGITTVDLAADTAGQVQNVLEQIDKLLVFHGTNKHQVLSATIYLKDMADYGAFNSAWDEWVDDGHEPARSVAQATLPVEEYRVKIAMVAAIPT